MPPTPPHSTPPSPPQDAEPHEAPSEAPSEAPLSYRPRGLRWFAAEFAVVVSGVLVALALNAWYQGRQDADREQAYLHQVMADLQESAHEFTSVIDRNAARLDQLDQLVQAFAAPEPPPDTVLAGLVVAGFDMAQPLTGTARALTWTGDIHLVRDDSVRSALIAFVDLSDSYVERTLKVEWDWMLPTIQTLYGYTAPMARGDHPFAAALGPLLADPVFYATVTDMRLALDNYTRLQRRMLQRIETTQQVVAAALSA